MKVHIHATGQYSLNGTADEFLVVLNRMNVTGQEILDHREKMKAQGDDVRHQVDFVLPEVDGLWDEAFVDRAERPKTSFEMAFVPELLELPSRLAAAKAGIPWPLKPKKPAKAKAKKKVRR